MVKLLPSRFYVAIYIYHICIYTVLRNMKVKETCVCHPLQSVRQPFQGVWNCCRHDDISKLHDPAEWPKCCKHVMIVSRMLLLVLTFCQFTEILHISIPQQHSETANKSVFSWCYYIFANRFSSIMLPHLQRSVHFVFWNYHSHELLTHY